ncbi:MAG: hypothetical protein ABFC63_10940 [Thermoguttaceae bacterium]
MNLRHTRRIAVFAAVLSATAALAGCTAIGSVWPFGDGPQDKALRKQVEADPFPSAKQTGLQQKSDS